MSKSVEVALEPFIESEDVDTSDIGSVGGNAKEQLRSIVERIERLEEDKKALADDLKDVYQEAKSAGFDSKALRAVVKRRKQDKTALEEHEAVVALYMGALGMLADLPLGQSAIERATKRA